MSDPGLSTELQQFIAEHFESVEKLEILLLLRSSPENPWSAVQVYQKIQSSIPSVSGKLRELAAEGFLKREANDSFRYDPSSEKLRNLVDLLEEAYRLRRIKIIEFIFSDRTDQLRKFSDAFRIRKEKE